MNISKRKGDSKIVKLEAAKYLISMREEISDWDEMEKLISQGHIAPDPKEPIYKL